MKIKANSNHVKVAVFFLFLLVASIGGFSQENINVGLLPQREFETTITLTPVFGMGKELTLPAVVVWDKDNKQIKVEIKSNRSNEERFVYSFPEKMFNKKVMKLKKTTWFDKGVESKDKAVERCVDIPALSNVAYENKKDVIRTLELKDAESKLTYSFKVTALKNGDTCRIPMRLYVASKQNLKAKSDKTRKIEYMAKFTLYIALWEACTNPEIEKQISLIKAEAITMSEQKIATLAELSQLTCATIRGKEAKIILSEKEKKLSEQFATCEALKEATENYNAILVELNSASLSYNAKLEEVKRRCSGGSQTQCSVVGQANEKLTELLLDIKNSKKSKASLQQEFERIKKTVDEPAFQKCKEYKVFNDLCNRIEARLK